MKAILRFESGKGFHLSLQPESEEESTECCRLARHFDAHPEGSKVALGLAYVTARKTGDDIEEMTLGISFR